MRPTGITIASVFIAGVLAISTASVFIRLGLEAAHSTGPGVSLLISALRLAFATLLLVPALKGLSKAKIQPGGWAFVTGAGIFLAVHFATWITSLSYTSVAASTVLVNTNPIWVALISWLWFKQAPPPLTLAGIAIAFAGGIVVGIDGQNKAPASNPALGNTLAGLGALAVSLYYLLGREAQRRGFSIGLYAAVAYGIAAVTLLPWPLVLHTGYLSFPPAFYFWVLLLALIPQLVGHTSFNWAVKWINPVLVTLVILLEPVGASLLAFLAFGETPGPRVLLGGLVLLAGVALAATGSSRANTKADA